MLRTAVVLVAVHFSLLAHAADTRRPADVLIRGGTVFNGQEDAPSVLDVVLVGDTVAYVGENAAAHFDAARTIEAQGKIVAPGFIDPHTHSDTYIRSQNRAQRRNAP